MMQYLKNEIQDVKAIDVLVVGDFNEDVSTKNIQDFMVEIGSCEVFSEVNEIDSNNRVGTFECGTKCMYYV